MHFNQEQKEAIDVILSGKNVFLTGQAGTGKSEVIKHVKKLLQDSDKKVGITSTTGISALAVGGITIHSWAGVGLANKSADILTAIVRRSKRADVWRKTDVLLIEEVSMMSADLFEKLDVVGRAIRRRIRIPFGGLQLVLCGDFCQLPPVDGGFCFLSETWKNCDFYTCYLTQNMRQSDARFQALLARARLGTLNKEDKQLLKCRIGAKLDGVIQPTRLYSRRTQVEVINNENLKMLGPKTLRIFKAVDETDAEDKLDSRETERIKTLIERSCPAHSEISLAIGAQVMLIYNLGLEAGLVNGSRGIIERYEGLYPVVKFKDVEIVVEPQEWSITISEDLSAFRKQIPLILAYASTIHKCQGATLDCVEVSLGSEIFAEGQFYVALSRVRSLEGLVITDLDFSRLTCNAQVKDFYARATK